MHQDPSAEISPPVPSKGQPSSSSGASGTQRGSARALPQDSRPLSANPFRSPGDALQEITKRFQEILENDGGTEPAPKAQAERDDPTQAEYIREDETQDAMQALGPARDEHEAKLRDLNIMDEDEPATDRAGPVEEDEPMDVDGAMSEAKGSAMLAQETSDSMQSDVESALTPADIRARHASGTMPEDDDLPSAPMVPSDDHADDGIESELALQEWQAQGQPSTEAEHMWRRYESLTHDLSYALCEQLRLILEPTMATRLKGDYRTGKRLNMKKIIPYIACAAKD